MKRLGPGLFECLAGQGDGVGPGTMYRFLLGGSKLVADPASGFQPRGVSGPSEVVDHGDFDWGGHVFPAHSTDSLVLYELHVGAFTPEGTLDAARVRLADLAAMGVTGISLMPVCQYAGPRSWGYDAVFPCAVHNGYGGPDGLKRFVRTAHELGLSVVADLSCRAPAGRGSVFPALGRYLLRDAEAPSGWRYNLDGPFSAGVRDFLVHCVLHWLEAYRLDGLRLDGTHLLQDRGGVHFLEELSGAVDEFSRAAGRRSFVFASENRNDPRTIKPRKLGGRGLDAMWNADFERALHVLLTEEKNAAYGDFKGVVESAAILNRGVWFDGRYSPWLKRSQGGDFSGVSGAAFIASVQNHEVVGDRPGGERLVSLVSFESQKLAAAFLAFSPFIPMLFMGEEYGETNPFRHFAEQPEHPADVAARKARDRVAVSRDWKDAAIPFHLPEALQTSVPVWEKRFEAPGKILVGFHAELFRLRREIPGLEPDLARCEARPEGRTAMLVLRHARHAGTKSALAYNFGHSTVMIDFSGFLPNGEWHLVLDSAAPKWGGPGSDLSERILCGETLAIPPRSACLYVYDG